MKPNFLEPQDLETYWSTYDGALKGKWDNQGDCGVEKGVHSLGLCRLTGNESLLVGIVVKFGTLT